MSEHTEAAAPKPSALVFAPSALLTVSIECAPDGGDELHVHAAGVRPPRKGEIS